MRVHAVPTTLAIAPDAQLTDVVFAADRVNGDLVLFQRRSADGWAPVTARQFAADVRSLAAGFLAAGIQPAERRSAPVWATSSGGLASPFWKATG